MDIPFKFKACMQVKSTKGRNNASINITRTL